MTLQLQKAIATIQTLSNSEQRQLLQILSKTVTEDNQPSSKHKASERPSKVKSFKNWFAKIEPATSELNLDDAKWNYLKEKHNL